MCFSTTRLFWEPNASISSTSSKITDADIQEHLNFDVGRGVFQTELGTQDQGPLTEFPGSTNSSTTQVNTEVPKGSVPAGTNNQTIFESDGTPVVKTITDVDVDQVNITVGVPALTRVKDNGTVKGLALRYKVQIQYNGDSGFTNVSIPGSTDDSTITKVI